MGDTSQPLVLQPNIHDSSTLIVAVIVSSMFLVVALVTGLLLKLYRQRWKKSAKFSKLQRDNTRPSISLSSVSDSEVEEKFSISTTIIIETVQENNSQTDLYGSDYFLNSLEEVLDFAA